MSEQQTFKGVFYIDGGCRNNGTTAAKVGWGIHGYIYDEIVIKPVTVEDHIVTSTGYIHKTKFKLDDIKLVSPVKYIDYFSSSLDSCTNNYAELSALLNALIKCKELNLTSLHVLTDSEYVKRGVNEWLPKWLKSNWIKSDGNRVNNEELWRNISNLLSELSNTSSITIEWIRAHDYNQGNVQADLLASIAVNYSFYRELKEDYVESDPKGYWKKDNNRHPFINFKRVYFNSISKFNIPGHYYQADPGGNDFIIGKRLPDTGYSVIRLNEEDVAIENIKQKQYDVSRAMNAIFMIKLDNVYNKNIYPYIFNHGKYSLNKHRKNNNLGFIDDVETPITTEINPTGLSLRAIESFNFLEEMLDKYIHYRDTGEDYRLDAFKIEQQDITELFFDISTKIVKQDVQTSYTLKPEYNVGFKNADVEVRRFDRNFTIPLILGVDLLPRNNLKRLETLRPKITLVTWSECENSFRYCSIIECSNGIGIWSNYHANMILTVK